MSTPRLVLVTRRFWPLVGGAEVVMARLAAGLRARGAEVTLLTAHWQNEWPREIEHHGVRVARLPNPAGRVWGTLRYMQSVAGWLRRNRSRFDLVYVSMLKHDAYAAITEGQRGAFPVALRAEGAGLTGDCHWQLQARCGARIKRRCLRADALLAPSRAIERELIAAGYRRDRIHYLPNGVPLLPPRQPADRQAARLALAELDRSLTLATGAPLVLYTGRLHAMKGLDDLIEAWSTVARQFPTARLWLVGDGPERGRLLARISDAGLVGKVTIVGPFDDVEDFLQAADVFALPSLEEGMSLALLEAMAGGLPAIASDIPANRQIITDADDGRLAPPRAPQALATAIIELLEQPALAARLGAAARQRVEHDFSLDTMVDRHLSLFEKLLAARRDDA